MLEGAYNFRDLGGLPTVDGRRTREGRLFRSDTLQELTDADVARLIDELGITFVIDLRQAFEAVEEGRGPLGRYPVCYANIPLVDVDSPAGAPGEILVTQYLDHLESDPNLPVAVELLALVVRRPTVLHCAGGKDRTGVVTALLLGILGVTEQAVVDDFLITAQNMDRIVERFSRWPRYHANMAKYPPETYRAEESTIRTFVREVNRRYGGAREWALGKGLSPDVIAQLEDALLED
jgi:protein-tyrosine phosphatase